MSRRTKAQRRRGRPRKDTERYPNGQPVKETAAKIMDTAVLARMRVFAGTFMGRAHLNGDISRDQLEAAQQFAQTVLAYRTAIQSPGKSTSGRPAGHDDAEYERRCRAAIARYDGLVEVLRQIDRTERINSLGVLDAAVLRDVDVHAMMGDLRLALNAIHRWSRLPAQAA